MTAQLLRKIESRLWAEHSARPPLTTRVGRALFTVVHGIGVDRLWVRAGYMTYLSLFYLVPVGALGLMLSARIGWQVYLTRWIENNLSPTAPRLAANIVEAMNRVDFGTVGIIGIGVILFAGVFMLIELEIDLGEIWIGRLSRSWWKRLVLYPLAIVLAPTLLCIILGFTTLAEASTTVWIGRLADVGTVGQRLHDWLTELPALFRITPYVVTWLMLSVLYFFGPVRPVTIRAALVGGIFAGVIWQLAQGAYLNFQFGFATFREVWGYLAQIPLLLLWIYVTWMIVYLGAETAFAWQYGWACRPKSLHQPFSTARNPDLPIEVAGYILLAGERPVTAVEISAARQVPFSAVEAVCGWLGRTGLIEVEEGRREIVYTASPRLGETTVARLRERWEPSVREAEVQHALPPLGPVEPEQTLAEVMGVRPTESVRV